MIPAIITLIVSLIMMLVLYLMNSREIADLSEALKAKDEDVERIDDDVDKVVEAHNENARTVEEAVRDLYEQLDKQAKYISTLTHGYAELAYQIEKNELEDEKTKNMILDLAEEVRYLENRLELLESYYDGQISRVDCRLGEMYYAKVRFHEALEDIDECLDFFHDEINTLMKTDEYIANAVKRCAEGGAALAKQVEDLDEMKDFIGEKVDQSFADLDKIKKEVRTHNNSLIEAWEALGELYSRMDTAEENINAEVDRRESEDNQLATSIKDLQWSCHLLDIDTDNIYDALYGSGENKGIMKRLDQAEDMSDCIIEELNRPKEGDVIKALKNIFDKFETD